MQAVLGRVLAARVHRGSALRRGRAGLREGTRLHAETEAEGELRPTSVPRSAVRTLGIEF